METKKGFREAEQQQPAFSVDDQFNSFDPDTATTDFKFVENWIETAIDEPQTPLPAPSETLPYLEFNEDGSNAPTDMLSAPLLYPECPQNQHTTPQPRSTSIATARNEYCKNETQPNSPPRDLSKVQNNPIPISSPHLPSIGNASPTLIHACKDISRLATAQHFNSSPEYANQANLMKHFPYRHVFGEVMFPQNACFDDVADHEVAFQTWGPPIQSVKQSPLDAQAGMIMNGYNMALSPRPISPSLFSSEHIPPAHISSVQPPPHLVSPSHVPLVNTPQTRMPVPEQSEFTAHSNVMASAGAVQGVMNRVPSATSGTSYVTQASLEVSATEAPQAARKSKNRYSKGASASNYCHVCGRNYRIEFAVCTNTKVGLCRKVMCDKCLLLYEPDSFQISKDPRAHWKCTHCRNACPPRARCKQYTRNNQRRRARKAAAALREAQNRQTSARAPQTLQQGYQLTSNTSPHLTEESDRPALAVYATRVNKPKRQRKSRKKAPQKKPKPILTKAEPAGQSEVSPEIPPNMPSETQLEMPPTLPQPIPWIMDDELSLQLLGSQTQPSAPPLMDPSMSQQAAGQSPGLLDQVLPSLHEPSQDRDEERNLSNFQGSASVDSIPFSGQMRAPLSPIQFAKSADVCTLVDTATLAHGKLETGTTEGGSDESNGNGSKYLDSFPDEISPVSIVNMARSEQSSKTPFVDQPGWSQL